MAYFLELKEKLKRVYSKYDTYLIAIIKFVVMFTILVCMNQLTGYISGMGNPYLIFLACALVCALFPQGMMAIVLSGFLLLQMINVSQEAALILALLLLIMSASYFIFKPGNSYLMVLAAMLTCWKLPGVIIVAAGMLFMPYAVIPIAFGIVLGTYVDFVAGNLTNLVSGTSTLTTMQKVVFLTNGIFKSQEMWLLILAAVITVCMVYIIRKMSVAYAWTIAAVTGAIVNVVVNVFGGYILNMQINVVFTMIASVVGLLLTLLVYVFVYSLDYSRVENIQFEDEDYYYYVKAVPKMTVAQSQINVKTISERVSSADTNPAESADGIQATGALPPVEKSKTGTIPVMSTVNTQTIPIGAANISAPETEGLNTIKVEKVSEVRAGETSRLSGRQTDGNARRGSSERNARNTQTESSFDTVDDLESLLDESFYDALKKEDKK